MGKYNKLKVAELRAALKERGLPVKGNKGDLVERLNVSDAASTPTAPSIPHNTKEPAPAATSGGPDGTKEDGADATATAAAAPASAADASAATLHNHNVDTTTQQQLLEATFGVPPPGAGSGANGGPDPMIQHYLKRLVDEPWDTNQWDALFQYINRPKAVSIDVARHYYDKFFERFPTAETYWARRALHELRLDNVDEACKIITTCVGIGLGSGNGGNINVAGESGVDAEDVKQETSLRFQHPDVFEAFVQCAKKKHEKECKTKTEREDALQQTYQSVFDKIGYQVSAIGLGLCS